MMFINMLSPATKVYHDLKHKLDNMNDQLPLLYTDYMQIGKAEAETLLIYSQTGCNTETLLTSRLYMKSKSI